MYYKRVKDKEKDMDYAHSLATELQTGEEEMNTEEELVSKRNKLDEEVNNLLDDRE